MAAFIDASELVVLVINKIQDICQDLSGQFDLNDTLESIDSVIEAVNYLDSVTRFPEDIYQDLSEAKRLIENSSSTSARTNRINTSLPGRPSYYLSQDKLQSLVNLGFKVPQISELLHVSTRTIERRLAQYGISVRSYSNIADDELDMQIQEIKHFNPKCGSKNLVGYLASRGIRVPRERIRQSLRRVDPLGVSVRKCTAIRRRVYSVSRPLALWHFDGNHKLIRWGFVIHGCIDGYSRVPVYLMCNTNNKAATVLNCFLDAINTWGMPSRVRSDRGGENIDVIYYMIERKGTGRGSALVGRSVHNQRIERMWRDVFADVLHLFHDLFTAMEDIGILSIMDDIDLWCLIFCFQDVINQKLQEWASAWIRHPLSSEGNMTPLQLWVQGKYESVSSHDEVVCSDYGIDWGGPVTTDNDEDNIDVDIPDCPLNEDDLNQLKELKVRNNSLLTTPWAYVNYYLSAKNFVRECTQDNEH